MGQTHLRKISLNHNHFHKPSLILRNRGDRPLPNWDLETLDFSTYTPQQFSALGSYPVLPFFAILWITAPISMRSVRLTVYRACWICFWSLSSWHTIQKRPSSLTYSNQLKSLTCLKFAESWVWQHWPTSNKGMWNSGASQHSKNESWHITQPFLNLT